MHFACIGIFITKCGVKHKVTPEEFEETRVIMWIMGIYVIALGNRGIRGESRLQSGQVEFDKILAYVISRGSARTPKGF
jgi:hypothetical protein